MSRLSRARRWLVPGTLSSTPPRSANPDAPIFRHLALLSFLNFAALGLAAPYHNLFLKEIGFTGTQIGLLISLTALLELVLTPASNALADRFQRHRWLYRSQIGVLGAANVVMAFISERFTFGTAFVAHNVIARGNNEMLSQLTLTKLEEGQRNIFGKIRLWGSVGWATATAFSGTLISLGSYPLTFLASGLTRFVMLPLTRTLPRQTHHHDRRQGFVKRQAGVMILMVNQFLFFAGLNAEFSFVWIFIQHDLGVRPEHVGFFAALFAIAEFVPMLLVDRFVARWGVRKVFLVGLLGLPFLWMSYGLIPDASWMIPLSLGRGVFFTLFLIGITLMVTRVSHPSNVATNRALIQVTMPALAILLTSPLAGWLYDNLGPRGLFMAAAGVALASVLYLLRYWHHLQTPETPETASRTES